jgi:adenylate cyclase
MVWYSHTFPEYMFLYIQLMFPCICMHVIILTYVACSSESVLYSKVAEGAAPTRVAVGDGIAGRVAASRRGVNIEDAYSDSRFNHEHDQQSGYVTKSVLCMPILDGATESGVGSAGRIIGVVQVLNKQTGHFTVEDEATLQAVCVQIR